MIDHTTPSYNVIGLMSGTSLDGLDMVYTTLRQCDDQWTYTIHKTHHIPYDSYWFHLLSEAIKMSTVDLLTLDILYGKWIGDQVRKWMDASHINADLIASHGHTIHHQPNIGVTCQIGHGQQIANITDTTTVANFREKDVLLGGQGAPLVPIGDRDLFSDFDICINLGGIANLSSEVDGQRIAYDIGVANMLLNDLAQKNSQAYDDQGHMASQGSYSPTLLKTLNNLEYYHRSYPKSTGYEWYRDQVRPLFDRTDISVVNQLTTAVHHITGAIADQVHMLISRPAQILITGGGAKNIYLINTLRIKLNKDIKLIIPEKQLIDYKEALIFAFLGVKRIRNEVNCLKTVTGAKRDSSGGVIYQP